MEYFNVRTAYVGIAYEKGNIMADLYFVPSTIFTIF
jgi:hypothetical protein